MALNKALLATEIENAFKASQLDPSPASQTTLANGLAQAIYNYLIQATVSTTVTGTTTVIGNGSAFEVKSDSNTSLFKVNPLNAVSDAGTVFVYKNLDKHQQ